MFASEFQAIEHQDRIRLAEENRGLIQNAAAHAHISGFRCVREMDHFLGGCCGTEQIHDQQNRHTFHTCRAAQTFGHR